MFKAKTLKNDLNQFNHISSVFSVGQSIEDTISVGAVEEIPFADDITLTPQNHSDNADLV